MKVRLILASRSRARKWLLRRLGIPFEAIDPGEVEKAVGKPREIAMENAERKALKVAEILGEGLIIGADTLITYGNRIIGKSRNREEVIETLRLLNASRHRVITGLAVVDASSKRLEQGIEETIVQMRKLSDEEINLYASIGESIGLTGGYAIQGLGGLLVERIEGCFYNVVGLPLRLLDELLRRFDVSLLTIATSYREL